MPMNNKDCINAYANWFVYDRSDVILVSTIPEGGELAANQTCPTGQGHSYRAPNGDRTCQPSSSPWK